MALAAFVRVASRGNRRCGLDLAAAILALAMLMGLGIFRRLPTCRPAPNRCAQVSYGKVHDTYWEGEKIEPLSDGAALLGLFLITGSPHRNAIGCFKLGIGAIMDLARFQKWGFEGVSKALQEMVDTGFIVRDARTGWTYICNALVKDPVSSPKGAIHAATLAARVPANTIVYQRLKETLEPQLKGYAKALEGKEGWPMRGTTEGATKDLRSPLPSPLPLPEPSPLPEPKTAAQPSAAPVVSRETSSKPKRGTRLADDWEPDEADREYARQFGWDDERIAAEGIAIRDWSKSSRNGVKLDWHAAWRTWVRRRNAEQPRGKPTPADRSAARRSAMVAAMGDELAGGPDFERPRDRDESAFDNGAGPTIEGFAEPGIERETGDTAGISGGDGNPIRMGADIRTGAGREVGDGILPDIAGRSAGGPSHAGDQAIDRHAPVPQFAEAGGHTEAGSGGSWPAPETSDASAGVVDDAIDPHYIPPNLRRTA